MHDHTPTYTSQDTYTYALSTTTPKLWSGYTATAYRRIDCTINVYLHTQGRPMHYQLQALNYAEGKRVLRQND
jgi:hypothetical protein